MCPAISHLIEAKVDTIKDDSEVAGSRRERETHLLSLNTAVVNHHLDQALSSPLFRNAERQSRFLRFVVDAALHSPETNIKEFDIAIAVYDRRADYDPRTDPIVRVEAARLRARLREYYELTPPERMRIDIPKGRYIPDFIPVGSAAPEISDISILVPPFRNLSPDQSDQNFCDGLTDEVVHKLAQDRRLRVITQTAAAWLEQREGPKPRYLLQASVRRAGAEIRLTLHLTELTGGATHLSNIYQATINDIFATQERLAEEIRADLLSALLISGSPGTRTH
jgi:TolB-like protein